ncbi:RDD family protein [Mesoterricola silvestris]|uniref:RDD domain-containing protein n=1 Tax=Mesoterricola silvestris TaxID=2927979 RepID=A0AA48GP02_9BACT|nr:RDD family protein [Mesoterricola silvestris]BDU73439.1 hypothetical protein METEAL_26130 [Mesoterricola silvestris]
MSDFNPYAAPAADLLVPETDPASALVYADRGTRLGAAILDAIILGIPASLLVWGFYAYQGLKFWVPVPGTRGIVLGGVATLLASAVDLAINGHLLARHGQTVGKYVCKIRIVKQDGSLPTLVDSFFKRRFLFNLAGRIPVIGGVLGLVDILLIFRSSHRCLHDDVAGTLVVKQSVPGREPAA